MQNLRHCILGKECFIAPNTYVTRFQKVLSVDSQCKYLKCTLQQSLFRARFPGTDHEPRRGIQINHCNVSLCYDAILKLEAIIQHEIRSKSIGRKSSKQKQKLQNISKLCYYD